MQSENLPYKSGITTTWFWLCGKPPWLENLPTNLDESKNGRHICRPFFVAGVCRIGVQTAWPAVVPAGATALM